MGIFTLGLPSVLVAAPRSVISDSAMKIRDIHFPSFGKASKQSIKQTNLQDSALKTDLFFAI